MNPIQPQGNGSGKFEIYQTDMGGWLRIFASRISDVPQDLPVFLSQSLTDWFRHRPHFRIRCVTPVTRNGDTVELHCWYDAHLFASTEAAPKPSSEKQN